MRRFRAVLGAAVLLLAAADARVQDAAGFRREHYRFLDWTRPHRFDEAVIHYVYDGDTLQDRDQRRIRLLGVDAPEVAHPEHDKYENEPGGIEASKFTEGKVRSRRVLVLRDQEHSTDKFGRMLGVVFFRDDLGRWVCLNWELVREGHAEVFILPDNRLCIEPEWYRLGVVARRRRAEDFRGLAKSYEQEGRRESAVEAYQQGIRLFPDGRELYEDLGEAYLGMNLPGFSVDIYLAYLEREPGDPEIRARLARAYERMTKAATVSFVDYGKKAAEEWRRLVGGPLDAEARAGLERLAANP